MNGQVVYPANSGAALQPMGRRPGQRCGGFSNENLLTFSADTGTVVYTQAKVLEDLPIMLTSPRIWEALGLPLTPFEDTIGFFADPGLVDEDAVRPFVAMKASCMTTIRCNGGAGNAVMGSNGEPVIGFGTAPIDIPNCERCHSAPVGSAGTIRTQQPNWRHADGDNCPHAILAQYALVQQRVQLLEAYYDIDAGWGFGLVFAAEGCGDQHADPARIDLGTSFTANYPGARCTDGELPQNTRLGNESVICQRCHADNVIAEVKSAT